MNRIGEIQDQWALGRKLLRLAGEVVLTEPADRLFGDVEILVGGSPLRTTAEASYLYACNQDVFRALRNYVSHFSDEPSLILHFAGHGHHYNSVAREEMVGDLLGGTRVPSLNFGESLREPDNLTKFANWSELFEQFVSVSRLANDRLWDLAFAIPDSPDLRRIALLALIRFLDSIQDSVLLSDWLEALVKQRVSLTEGMLPDSPALAIIKRILDIDVERGVNSIRALLRPTRDLPFRFGYFQLSLTGVLLAKLSTASSFSEYRSWIWNEIDYLRDEGINSIEDYSLGLALLAAFLAIAIIVENATTLGIKLLDKQIERSVEKCRNPEEKKLFLRFLGDSLSQAITESNLSLHLPKLLTFFKHGKDEPSLVRPQNLLLQLLRKVFEPARELLTS